jgi:hypothetical protein
MCDQGGNLREIMHSINWITAKMQASDRENSILTTHINDDKALWKELRRELVKEGFSSSILRKHNDVIKQYILEFGDRNVLDEEIDPDRHRFHPLQKH